MSFEVTYYRSGDYRQMVTPRGEQVAVLLTGQTLQLRVTPPIPATAKCLRAPAGAELMFSELDSSELTVPGRYDVQVSTSYGTTRFSLIVWDIATLDIVPIRQATDRAHVGHGAVGANILVSLTHHCFLAQRLGDAIEAASSPIEAYIAARDIACVSDRAIGAGAN